MTSQLELFSSHAIVKPNCNLVVHSRSMTSELGFSHTISLKTTTVMVADEDV